MTLVIPLFDQDNLKIFHIFDFYFTNILYSQYIIFVEESFIFYKWKLFHIFFRLCATSEVLLLYMTLHTL